MTNSINQTLATALRTMTRLGSLMLIAFIAASCAASTTSVAVDLEETATAPTPTPIPADTATPTPVPTPEPSPTPAPTPTPEPTATPDLDAQFADFAAQAEAAIDAASKVQIVQRSSSRILTFDLDTVVLSQIDQDRRVSSLDLSFEGDWKQFLNLTNGAESDLDFGAMTMRYVFDDVGRTLFTMDPLPPDTDPATPWVSLSLAQLAAGQGIEVAQGLASSGDSQIANLYLFAGVSGEVADRIDRRRGEDDLVTFEVLVPNTEAVLLVQADTYSSLASFGIDFDAFTGTTPVRFTSIDDQLREIQFSYESILDDAAAQGAPPEMTLVSISDHYVIDFDVDFDIEVPAAELITVGDEPTQPLASGIAIGDCFAKADFETVYAPITVACDEPHFGEVYYVETLTEPFDAPYPGEDDLLQRASERCNIGFEPMMGSHQDTSVLNIRIFYPDPTSWQAFDREIVCFVRFREPTSTPLASLDPLRHAGQASGFGLTFGDCLNAESFYELSFDLVDCEEQHLFEVYYEEVLTDSAYPGDNEIAKRVDQICVDQFEAALNEDYATSKWTIERLYPNEISWDLYDDRLVTCAITTYQPVIGSALGS